MLLCAAAGAMAQSNRTRVKLLMPLVFDKQKVVNDTLKSPSIQSEKKSAPDLDYDRFWLDDVLSDRERVDHERYRTILKSPEVVPYNSQNMREAPKEYVVNAKEYVLNSDGMKWIGCRGRNWRGERVGRGEVI